MMQIVIDINEDVFTRLFDNGTEDYAIVNDDLFAIAKAIRKGTPLPEHHGRLIDADKLELDDGYSNYDGYYHKYSQSQIYNAPTVLEAEEKADANSVGFVCDIFDEMNRDEQIKVWQYVNEVMEGE